MVPVQINKPVADFLNPKPNHPLGFSQLNFFVNFKCVKSFTIMLLLPLHKLRLLALLFKSDFIYIYFFARNRKSIKIQSFH